MATVFEKKAHKSGDFDSIIEFFARNWRKTDEDIAYFLNVDKTTVSRNRWKAIERFKEENDIDEHREAVVKT